MTVYLVCLELQHGETALHMAASGGHVEIVQLLHSKGIDLNLKDKVSIHTVSFNHKTFG